MDESSAQPVTPKQVLDLIEEIRCFKGIEPELQQVNPRHWRITFTLPPIEEMPAGLDVVLDVKRSPTGRVTKPQATVSHPGGQGTFSDWHKMMTAFYKSQVAVTIPDIAVERPVESAPAQVRRQYNELIATRPQGDGQSPVPNIRVGREDSAWVIGVDYYPCGCEGFGCEHGYSVRLYYVRKGDVWRPDRKRLQVVIRSLDVSEQWRERIEIKLATLLSGGMSDTGTGSASPLGSRDISSTPAGTPNSVAVRKSTVRRV